MGSAATVAGCQPGWLGYNRVAHGIAFLTLTTPLTSLLQASTVLIAAPSAAVLSPLSPVRPLPRTRENPWPRPNRVPAMKKQWSSGESPEDLAGCGCRLPLGENFTNAELRPLCGQLRVETSPVVEFSPSTGWWSPAASEVRVAAQQPYAPVAAIETSSPM